MKLGVGIDTGGTYTDAVVFDFDDRVVLGTAKALTTKADLSVGILEAVDGLPLDLVRRADIISLSTTLATNACVEDKGGRAKLIFFGGDRKVIDEVGGKYGLPASDDILILESFSKFSGEVEREPDWDLFRSRLDEGFGVWDGVGIIEMNAVRNGAVVERKAKEIFRERSDIPVVCGHELFSELNCLQRGASTLLNAGLFPVISEFLKAVKRALICRGIGAPLVIVRSDGSLMSEESALFRPVDTLLCGPAASAIGGTFLTDNPNSIIVDMGGTTTDIALVNDGVPVTVTDGVSIGKWKTFVDGLYVKTFGLGGDTAIHYDGNRLFLEDYRVVPLCVAAKRFPGVIGRLKELQLRKHTEFLYEHVMLMKDIGDGSRYSDEERAFCAALKDGPLIISEAAKAVGKDIYTLNVKRLLKDGVVLFCGLTPTDIMHIKGDFNGYDGEASRLGAEFAAFNLDVSVSEFCDLVYDEVKRKLYLNIVTALLENRYPDYKKYGVNRDVERFIDDNFRAALNGRGSKLLSTMFRTDFTLVGIGAPIGIFLDEVADMLGTHAVIPEHHEVANALGAVIGSVRASFSVEIKPVTSMEGNKGFMVFGSGGKQAFEDREEAIEFAVREATEGVKAEAVKRGAKGSLTVTSEVHGNDAQARDCSVYLGTTVTAYATGSFGF